MLKRKTIVASIGAAFFGAGCASLGDSAADDPWRVEPAYTVKHAGATAESLYRLGRYYQGRVRYDRAIAAYQEALARNPAAVDARNGLGVIFATQGRYDDAVRELEAAVKLAPHLAYLHNNLGYVHLLRGAGEEAVRSLKEAQRLDPANERAAHNLQLGLARLGSAAVTQQRSQPPEAANTVAREAVSTPPRTAGADATKADQGAILVRVDANVYELKAAPGQQASATAGTAAGAVPASAATAVRPFKLEVSNGNGVNGMARRVAGQLKERGVPTGRLTNYPSFDHAYTEIHYRAGYHAEAAGLNAALAKPVPLVATQELRGDIHVRLVLGRDVRAEAALFGPDSSNARMAAAPADRTAQ